MTQDLRIDTKHIKWLRSFLNTHKELLSSISQFAQLRVVIDVNIVVSDLLHKIKHPERGNTAIEELVQASVFEVFAPRWLEKELSSAFQQVARKRKLEESDLWTAWAEYRKLIQWDENFDRIPADFNGAGDPKDIPYVHLGKAINASGILSKDEHIAQMGGNRLSLEFILETRKYARAAVTSVGIRVSGHFLGAVTLSALKNVLNLVQGQLQKLPPKLKTVLLCAVVFALLHPGSRAWIMGQLKKLEPAFTFLSEGLITFLTIEAQKREEAEKYLAQVQQTVKAPTPD
jgi:predicted nucleic acid-binding protein